MLCFEHSWNCNNVYLVLYKLLPAYYGLKAMLKMLCAPCWPRCGKSIQVRGRMVDVQKYVSQWSSGLSCLSVILSVLCYRPLLLPSSGKPSVARSPSFFFIIFCLGQLTCWEVQSGHQRPRCSCCQVKSPHTNEACKWNFEQLACSNWWMILLKILVCWKYWT